MALPTTQDAKDYLRVEHATEDALITALLARAKAAIETFVGYAMTAVAVTYVDYNQRYTMSELELPGPFLVAGTPPVVTDVNGVVVDATTYSLDPRAGKIRAKYGGGIFGARPYSVVATIGLSVHPDYAASLEAVASTAILDMVAHLYQNRNPAVVSQGDEGGGSATLSADAIPSRIRQDLMLLPCTRGLIVA